MSAVACTGDGHRRHFPWPNAFYHSERRCASANCVFYTQAHIPVAVLGLLDSPDPFPRDDTSYYYTLCKAHAQPLTNFRGARAPCAPVVPPPMQVADSLSSAAPFRKTHVGEKARHEKCTRNVGDPGLISGGSPAPTASD